MPIGPYKDFDACCVAMQKKGKSLSSAKKICGFMEKQMNKSAEFVSRLAELEAAKKMGLDLSAVWGGARTNNLPDNAFAYVEPGGKKETINGKTFSTPRSLRHLPHHTSAVKSGAENDTVDLPHLRNALARVNQLGLSNDIQARAKAHLMRHAKALGIGEGSVSKKEGKN